MRRAVPSVSNTEGKTTINGNVVYLADVRCTIFCFWAIFDFLPPSVARVATLPFFFLRVVSKKIKNISKIKKSHKVLRTGI